MVRTGVVVLICGVKVHEGCPLFIRKLIKVSLQQQLCTQYAKNYDKVLEKNLFSLISLF